MNALTHVLLTAEPDVVAQLGLEAEVCDCHIDAALREGPGILHDGLRGFNNYVAWRDALMPGINARLAIEPDVFAPT